VPFRPIAEHIARQRHSGWRLRLGRLWGAASRPAQAKGPAAARGAAEISPQLAAVRAALEKGDDGAAREALRLVSPEEFAQGQLLRVQLLRRLDRTADALDALREAEAAAPVALLPVELFAELCEIHLARAEAEAALAAVERGLARFPADHLLLLRRAAIQVPHDGVAAAETALREALDGPAWSVPLESAVIVALRAIAAASAADAARLLPWVRERQPGSWRLARLQGDLALRWRDFDLAVEAYRAALPLAKGPSAETIAKGLRTALVRSGRPLEEAEPAPPEPAAPAAPALKSDIFRVCAITNVYNEAFNLPIWLKHYGGQVGIRNCVVLDHGSDDGSTEDLRGAGVIRMPRGPVYDERHRMRMVTDLANNMLNYYDAVLYSDCDEMLVADPARWEDLTEYCRAMRAPVVHAIGLNLRQDITREGPISPALPVLSQRSLVQFVGAMCKPLVIREPISWGGGFHSCQHPPRFDDLYLFHLRHADLGQALARLRTTREIRFAREGGGKHHRRDDFDLAEANYCTTHRMRVEKEFDFSAMIEKFKGRIQLSGTRRYALRSQVASRRLYRVPDRFRHVF
jgi:tetratricopeptide (TPR) repeat protein